MTSLAALIAEKKPFTRMSRTLVQCKSSCHTCASEDEDLQRKAMDERRSSSGLPTIIQDVRRSPGQLLEPSLRAFFEPRFGMDFSRVRVHTDQQAAASARAVRALAYTVGNDIVFARGHYAPETERGRALIAHELTHVVQQSSESRGVQAASMNRQAYDTLERQADAVATRVVAGAQSGAVWDSVFGLQRQPVPGGGQQETDACAKLENDRESFSIMAARYFLSQVDPGPYRAVKTVECHDNPASAERLECIVTFSDGNKVTVTWLKNLNNVEAQRQTNHGREWCVYHYECDSTGAINYIKKGCSSDYQPKPSAGKNLVG